MKRFVAALLVAGVLTAVVAVPASAQPCYPDCPPPEVGFGGDDNLVGQFWCPGSTVSIYVDGGFAGTAQVDQNGEFNFPLKNLSPGRHVIEVVGLDATCEEVRTVRLTIDIAGGATGNRSALPFTGSNISVGVLLLGALVIVGATALVAGRRRKTAIES